MQEMEKMLFKELCFTYTDCSTVGIKGQLCSRLWKLSQSEDPLSVVSSVCVCVLVLVFVLGG